MTDSNVSSDKGDHQGQSSSTVETFTFRVEPTSVPVFITKLCLILDDTSIQKMISWSNDGERFCVFDIPGFSKVVLPRYFKHSNWPSFVRQLNMYGFHKINDSFSARHGQLICEFHHPMFYRNGRQSLRKIRRNSRRSMTTATESYPHSQSSQQQQRQPHNINNRLIQASPLHESTPKDSSSTTTSVQTSAMPISSLLTSNNLDYNDEETISVYDSATNDDTATINDNKESLVSNKLDDTNKNSIKTTNRHHSKKKHVNNQRNKEENDNCDNSTTDQHETYDTLEGYLNQLQTKTAHLNKEVSLLKQHVAKQQESVIDLLNYLTTITKNSEHQIFQDMKLSRTSEGSFGGDLLDGKPHSCCHHHHNINGLLRSTDDATYTDDINTIKKGIWDILQESKRTAKMAKKDHHMHLNPLTDKVGTILPLSTSLGNNKGLQTGISLPPSSSLEPQLDSS